MSLKLHDCEFITSAVKPHQYPKYSYPEIVLVGRSNVGKSSLINALVNRKKFARISSEPGRTQTINFYRIDFLSIVDLPGYGFARVPESVRLSWKPMIEGYLTKRENLAGILQLIDIRHQPTNDDQMMARWITAMNIPAWVVATKADKISRSKYKASLKAIVNCLKLPGIIFSAQTKLGKEDLIVILNELASTG